MNEIADGKLETRIPRTGNDEITGMALAVRGFRENAKENICNLELSLFLSLWADENIRPLI